MYVYFQHLPVYCVLESLFGMAPFASQTMEELEDKVLDLRPVEVSVGLKFHVIHRIGSMNYRHLLTLAVIGCVIIDEPPLNASPGGGWGQFSTLDDHIHDMPWYCTLPGCGGYPLILLVTHTISSRCTSS